MSGLATVLTIASSLVAFLVVGWSIVGFARGLASDNVSPLDVYVDSVEVDPEELAKFVTVESGGPALFLEAPATLVPPPRPVSWSRGDELGFCGVWGEWLSETSPVTPGPPNLLLSAPIGIEIVIVSFSVEVFEVGPVPESGHLVYCSDGSGPSASYVSTWNFQRTRTLSLRDSTRTYSVPPDLFRIEPGSSERIRLWFKGDPGLYQFRINLGLRIDQEDREVSIGSLQDPLVVVVEGEGSQDSFEAYRFDFDTCSWWSTEIVPVDC